MIDRSLPLAAYIRVSRVGAREEEQLRSPELQWNAIERWAKAEGWTVERFPDELDVSGSKAKRPVLDAIVRRVKDGSLGGIVVANLDRLSRLSPKERVALFEEIEDAAGGVVRSAAQDIDPSTPEGRYVREVFLGIARLQWEKYQEGWERSKESAIARGVPINSRPPVGYRRERARTKADKWKYVGPLLVDPAAGPVVREVFERRARGEGPSALGQFLEGHGVRTSQESQTWSKSAIYGLLRNRVYLGEIAYGLDRRYVNPDAHEALVDLALWQAAQHPNGPRKLSPTRGDDAAYLLSGIVRCAACGYCLQGTTTSRGKPIYRCTRRHAAGVCPDPVRVPAQAAEDAGVAAFWRQTRNLEAERSTDTAGEVRMLQEALERAERAFEQWTSPEVQEAIGDTREYAKGLRERRDARDCAAAEFGRAREANAVTVPIRSVQTLRAAWERMTTGERRELLALRFDCIALRRGDGSLTVYPTGTAPTTLPRRGFRRDPELAPFPDPPVGAFLLTL